MSSEIKINLNGMGYMFVHNGNYFLSTQSAWPQQPIICKVLAIIISSGVAGVS